MRNEPKRPASPDRTEPQKPHSNDILIFLAALVTVLMGFAVFLLLRPGDTLPERPGKPAVQIEAPQPSDTLPEETASGSRPAETTASRAPAETISTAPPTEAPKSESPYASFKEGDRLYFGTFEQDGNRNTTDPIQWRVLYENNGRLLLVSEMALDCRQYHSWDTAVTWAECDLRAWLNGDFYQNAFTSQEKALIPLVQVPGDDNGAYNIDGGEDTQDRIFIPSVLDMERYFIDGNDRMCWPTRVAVQMGAYQEPNTGYSTWWLLRTPGDAGDKVANINCDGAIDLKGSTVESPYGAIRIMMWLSIEE